MYLLKKIKAVNRLFRQLDGEISRYKRISGFSCIAGCGDCCIKPNMNATVLEFLPAAYHLFVIRRHEEYLVRLENFEDPVCVFYNPFAKRGMCENYAGRGMICRLFGSSVRIDKHGNKSLITCKKLKSTLTPENYDTVMENAPDMASWYMKLYGIDPELSTRYFPVNEAIRKALEIILFYHQYDTKETA